MNVTILTVGKLKEDYLRRGCEEYKKRLGAYCNITVTELPEERCSDNPSPAEIKNVLSKEGSRILSKIPAGAYTVAMCIEGKQLSSPQLAQQISSVALSGKSSLCFIIGGSFGLDDMVKKSAALRLSMSEMTFPHQLARMLLLEQIYRAFSINQNGKYHK